MGVVLLWSSVRLGRFAFGTSVSLSGVNIPKMTNLVNLRRARDFIDREYAQSLEVSDIARIACMSEAHFSRSFRAAFGESPHSYLLTRRIERAKALLRQGESVTRTCFSVGYLSLGSFSSRFTEIVGESPTEYRERDHGSVNSLPSCLRMIATRPQRGNVLVRDDSERKTAVKF